MDAMEILKADVKKINLNKLQKLVADVDFSNTIDSNDSMDILKTDVKKGKLNWKTN